jgi:hypothetical protein
MRKLNDKISIELSLSRILPYIIYNATNRTVN